MRRGISLLEVMFSIGVVAVGMLGVVAVLPLALQQVGRGRVLDNAARVGQNAVHEAMVRGMASPNSWRTATGPRTSSAVSPALVANVGYAIDPLFVSVNGNSSNTAVDANLFPYFKRANATDPRMNRITLAAPITAINNSGMIRWSEAERIFVLQDELTFDAPEEKAALPRQNFGSGAARMFDGSTSWMATLSPNYQAGTAVRDTYILSVVVFHARNMLMPMDGVTERLVSVDLTSAGLGSGLGGGDVQLQSAAVNDLVEVRAGQWIMLMGNIRTTTSLMPVFRWYRIVTSDSEPFFDSTASVFKLDATLEGPDWPTNTVSTSGVLVQDVVAVYERTMRLETSSLWSN